MRKIKIEIIKLEPNNLIKLFNAARTSKTCVKNQLYAVHRPQVRHAR